MKLSILSIGLLISQLAFANLPTCQNSSVDLRKAPVGFRCQTSQGFIFERVERKDFGEAWKDDEGQIWSDRIASPAYAQRGQVAAVLTCQNLNSAVPTKEQFQTVDSKGAREVFNQMQYKWYWTSSVFPVDTDFAYIYHGSTGEIFLDLRAMWDSIRCVSR